ncbi:MAG: cell division protein FtsQ/DivIB [Glaciecola sp.]|jgi:cell division protein FtsQ
MKMHETPAHTSSRSIGVIFLIAVCLGLAWASFVLWQWMMDAQRTPIHVIEVSGKTQYIDNQALVRYIRSKNTASFFAVDINDVHRDVVAQPWIYQASVRKKWPNTLQVFIVEQQPVAQWNSDLLLNAQGQPFAGDVVLPGLPELFGPNGAEKTALSGLNSMRMLLKNQKMDVQSLILTERFAWQVTLDNGIQLNLGRHEFINRLQRFVNLYPLLKREGRPIKYVDLRYDTGAAVGWQV